MPPEPIEVREQMKTIRISRAAVVNVCAIILGVVFLVAGTGKALDQSEFVLALESSFLPSWLAAIVARSLPWSEILLGLLLVLGLFTRIASALSVVLISGFIFSNVWLLTNGGGTGITCGDCFGIWERFLGSLSPTQALLVDFALLGLSLVVLARTPGKQVFSGFWIKARTSR